MPKSIRGKLLENNEITQITEEDFKGKIYTIRGQKVMLDFDLAKIYGYETKYLNRQVLRNKEKFEGEDFMFRLIREETENFSRCQNVTLDEAYSKSKNLTLNNRRGQNIKYLPYAFTEQGIYMLMTVLKGPLAIKQSRTLIMMFKKMKDYIIETNNTLAYRDNLQLAIQVSKNSQSIAALELKDHKIITEVKRIDEGLKAVTKKMKHMVTKSDLPPIFLDFNRTAETREYLLLNGEPIRAKDAYLEIYKHAKSKIYIIDNYISIKLSIYFKSLNVT